MISVSFGLFYKNTETTFVASVHILKLQYFLLTSLQTNNTPVGNDLSHSNAQHVHAGGLGF